MTDSTNVRVGITGAIYTAPLGTALPATSAAALAAAYEELGYVSEDGVTPNFEDSVNKLKAWQNGKIVRTIITETSINFSFTLIETKRAVMERFLPGSSVVDLGGNEYSVDVVDRVPDPRVWIIDAIDGTIRYRFVCPRAELTERGEIPLNNDDPMGYPFMIEALPDDANNRRLLILCNDTALAA